MLILIAGKLRLAGVCWSHHTRVQLRLVTRSATLPRLHMCPHVILTMQRWPFLIPPHNSRKDKWAAWGWCPLPTQAVSLASASGWVSPTAAEDHPALRLSPSCGFCQQQLPRQCDYSDTMQTLVCKLEKEITLSDFRVGTTCSKSPCVNHIYK